MPGTAKRLAHPLLSYFIGLFFMILTLIVFFGVIHHLAISSHGPEILGSFIKKYEAQTTSEILNESQKLLEMEKHNHFHNSPVEYPTLPENMQPVCFICHSAFPHTKSKRIRSLMNMHTQFFTCETCHVKKRVGYEIVYKWYNPMDENIQGPFFGTSYNPQTGRLLEGADPIAKITPFFKSSSSSQHSQDFISVLQLKNTPFVKDYIKVRDKLSPEEREGIKNKFHQNIKPKGHNCMDCHTESGILNFKQLGFSENRIKYLRTLEILGMLSQYEDFYLPELFTDPSLQSNDKKK